MKEYIINDGLHKKDCDRKAVRVLVTNDKKEVLAIYYSSWAYTSIPGGGVESDESLETSAIREILEETGYPIKIKKELGCIIEKRKELNYVQYNFCYWGVVDGKATEPRLTPYEKERGLTFRWMSIDKLKETIKKENNRDYRQEYFRKRDLKLISLFEEEYM